MREVLTDVVHQTMGLFDKVKVTGTAKETKFEAVDTDKVLFLKAFLDLPLPEAEGVWGIGDLPLLNGLLNYAPYRTDQSSFRVNRVERGGEEVVESFEFKEANGSGATIRTIQGSLVGEQAVIPKINWDVTLVPQKSKVAAFQQLSSLYGSVDKYFGVEVKDGDLIFSIGDDNSSTHRANMIFESNVEGKIPTGMTFSTSQFLSVIKQAGGHPIEMTITARSAIGLAVTTPLAVYNYFLRAKH